MDPAHDKPEASPPINYVLVVDDERSVRHLVTDILEFEDFKVVAVEHGQAALDYLHAHPAPACILLDYDMPHMNGGQFRQVQQYFPGLQDIPVILMTAAVHIERKAGELHLKRYLAKPFDIDRLVELVASCCLQERVV